MLTILIFSLLVYTVQSALSNLVSIQSVSHSQINIYNKAENIINNILSGNKLHQYLLTRAEKNNIQKQGADFNFIRNYIFQLGKYKFIKNEKKTTYRKNILINDEKYMLIIERKIIESSPFLWGFILKLKGKETIELRAVLSYYDLIL